MPEKWNIDNYKAMQRTTGSSIGGIFGNNKRGRQAKNQR
jgi:hypothetical protein